MPEILSIEASEKSVFEKEVDFIREQHRQAEVKKIVIAQEKEHRLNDQAVLEAVIGFHESKNPKFKSTVYDHTTIQLKNYLATTLIEYEQLQKMDYANKWDSIAVNLDAKRHFEDHQEEYFNLAVQLALNDHVKLKLE